MKAFVFMPSNEFIGKFNIATTEELPEKLQAFLASKRSLPPNSYVEASGRTWTIVALDPLKLSDGRVSPAPTVAPATPQRPIDKAAAIRLLVSGLVLCVIGIGITIYTKITAPTNGGSTHLIASGPIIFGIGMFAKGFLMFGGNDD